MESANLHSQHELQEQFSGYSSLPTQSSFKLSNTHYWNPNTLLNIGAERMPNYDTTSMKQNYGIFYGRNLLFTQQSANDILLAKIKQEMTNSFPYVPQIYKEEELYSDAHNPQSLTPSIGFNHAFPNTDISSSLGLNLQTFDLLTSSSYGGSSIHSSLSLGHDFMQDLQESSSNNSIKVAKSGFRDGGVTRTKRGSNSSKTKESDVDAKKTRVASRSSCPPLKVRKEKLGDRIAALQKLVAPFGKTDTASVLTEAIGYIQFLEDQVQTLSVPYMKLSHAKSRRTIQSGSSEDEEKGDLKSRGLCLAPLSSASYIDTCAGGMWPIP